MSISLWRRIQQSRYRWLLRLAALLVLGLVVFLWAPWARPRSLLIENRSGQSIAILTVTAGGETSTFRNVAKGAEVTISLPKKDADPLDVEGQLADKTRIRGHFSSLPEGKAGEHNRLVVMPGGEIVPRPSDQKPPG